MKRKIDSILDNWLADRSQAIMLSGARQTGKTYSIKECFKRNNVPYAEINFATDKTALSLFTNLSRVDDFYAKLSLIASTKLIPHQTCVFLDEIQEIYQARETLLRNNPQAYHSSVDLITLIKKLVEDGRFRYALSGSLLGISLSGVASNPVGYLDTYTMHPLDFEEFLWAKQIGEDAILYLREHLLSLTPVEENIHTEILRLFKQYLLVGGMPEAVARFVSEGDLSRARIVQSQIIRGYHNDIQKYAPVESRILIGETYASLPGELNRKDKHFRKSKLDYPNSKNIDLAETFLWLTNAGVALPTYNVDEPAYPLTLSENRKTLKLFSSDIGLLSCQLFDKGGAAKILEGDLSINFGAPFENAVAQELSARGYRLYYYNGKKTGEIDFLIQQNGKIIPLEVKSGSPEKSGLYSHKALDNLMGIYPSIDKAFLVSQSNVFKENDSIINLPVYMLMFFPEQV